MESQSRTRDCQDQHQLAYLKKDWIFMKDKVKLLLPVVKYKQ